MNCGPVNDFKVRKIGNEIELIKQIPNVYLGAWDKGYGIGYPPRERLDWKYIREWVLDSDKEAFVALDKGKVIGVFLNKIHGKKVEGCGWAILPDYQRKGIGSTLAKASLGESSEYFADDWKREVGANYVSNGSQYIAMGIGLGPATLAPALYNNLKESYESKSLAVSSGEVIMSESKKDKISVADKNMKKILELFNFNVSYLDADKRILKGVFELDDFNGRMDIEAGSEGKDLKDILLFKPSYSKLIKVNIFDLQAQKYMEKNFRELKAIPCGLVDNEILYLRLPDGQQYPEYCEGMDCVGGCKKNKVSRIHSPFPEIKKVYELQKKIYGGFNE